MRGCKNPEEGVYTCGQFSDLLLYGITAEEFAVAHPDHTQ